MRGTWLHVSNDWLVVGGCWKRAACDYRHNFTMFVRNEGEWVAQWLPAKRGKDCTFGGDYIKIINKVF